MATINFVTGTVITSDWLNDVDAVVHDVLDGATTKAEARTALNVEDGADVTDATNVDAAGAVMNTDTTTASMSFVVDEDDMSSDSATKVPTQQSVKAYVDDNAGGGGVSNIHMFNPF